MKDNHTPGPDIYRVMLQEPGRIFDRKFVQFGEYQKQSDLLGQCLGALRELVDAMKRYSMDVDDADTQAPYEHRVMMKKATAILAKRKGEASHE